MNLIGSTQQLRGVMAQFLLALRVKLIITPPKNEFYMSNLEEAIRELSKEEEQKLLEKEEKKRVRIENLRKFSFKKGQSGHDRIAKKPIVHDDGEVEWVDDPEKSENKERFKYLHKWKKGEIPNPLGNPTNYVSLSWELKKYLTEHPEEAREVVFALVREAKAGNIIAIREIIDRVDGKVVETHKLEGFPLQLVFVPASELLSYGKVPKVTEVIEGESRELLLPKE